MPIDPTTGHLNDTDLNNNRVQKFGRSSGTRSPTCPPRSPAPSTGSPIPPRCPYATGHADNTYRPDRNITRAHTTPMTCPVI